VDVSLRSIAKRPSRAAIFRIKPRWVAWVFTLIEAFLPTIRHDIYPSQSGTESNLATMFCKRPPASRQAGVS
jgi:hypothetical protein